MDIKNGFVKARVVVTACAITIILNALDAESVETGLKLALAISYGVLAKASESKSIYTEELAARMLNLTYLLLAMLGSVVFSEKHFPGLATILGKSGGYVIALIESSELSLKAFALGN